MASYLQENELKICLALLYELSITHGKIKKIIIIINIVCVFSGRTWTLELDDEVSDLTTNFTDQLINDGLMRKILTLLLEVDVTKEMDKLGHARALGDTKHKYKVLI